MDTLISNATVGTVNERMDVLFGAYLGITDGKISYIGKEAPKEQPQTIIDGTGMVAMPGLVNCHTHLATTVLRSFVDDAARAEALEQQLYRQDKLDERSARAAALLGIAECLRFGITSVSDLYYYPEATAQAVAQSGIKANLALSLTSKRAVYLQKACISPNLVSLKAVLHSTTFSMVQRYDRPRNHQTHRADVCQERRYIR